MQQHALSARENVDEADRRFMQEALRLAHQAAALGEVPVGAIVVRDGQVIGSGHNAPISHNDPTAHAEIVALRAAAAHSANYRIPGATLYVTAEPCMMCVGALLHARIGRVIFGCTEPKAGALGSRYDLGRDGRANHRVEVIGGVGADSAAQLLQDFFRLRRGA